MSEQWNSNLGRLYEILGETTAQLRKGERIVEEKHGNVEVTHIYAMPHENEAPDNLEKVDMHFVVIGVDKGKAETHKADLIAILDAYPDPERLANGPSYIELGGTIGDQGQALCLMALGKVLRLWDVMTPAVLGVTGEVAEMFAGRGGIMISGYRKEGS